MPKIKLKLQIKIDKEIKNILFLAKSINIPARIIPTVNE